MLMPFCFYKPYQRKLRQQLHINIKYIPMKYNNILCTHFNENTTTLYAYIIKSVFLCIALCFNKICNSPWHWNVKFFQDVQYYTIPRFTYWLPHLFEWQTSWNNSIGNKLLDIKPTIGEYQSVVRNIRREEVVLARLRLGHTRVTHSYLLQGEEHPQCVGCDAPFTVRHFLLECGDFAQVRNNCFHVDNMKELFQDIHIDSIMTFLRQINLFNKI